MERMNARVSRMLDIWRISACLAVMFGHGFSFFQLTVLKDEVFFFYIQNFAVLIFVMLSGFLHEFSLTNKKNSFSLWGGKRIIHIYSYYLIGLVVILAFDSLHWIMNVNYLFLNEYTVKSFVENVLMLQTKMYEVEGGVATFASAKPLWTLSAEWWMNWLHAYLKIGNKEKRPLFGIAFVIFVLYFMTGVYHSYYVIAAYVSGILIYHICESLTAKCAYVLTIFSFIAIVIYGLVVREAYRFVIVWLLAVLFVGSIRLAGSNEWSIENGIHHMCWSFLRKFTFPLYIVHYSVFQFIIEAGGYELAWKGLALGVVISVLLAGAVYRLGNSFERVLTKKLMYRS